ncbi:amino acid racemase [Brevundimonas naejangsanensis]|uniref:Amino acid racemase n=1 Tax=Brevundimonas naejangsanensis TaxID=588932 RepID=A0A494RFK6_9CAUL|nr:amino acid racemase [Brevundimonas naejangsanensis]AYG94219.1 amino acid racemase [Brevundimonas naejangsanensis]
MGRILGVLGGMGPAATLAFLTRVQALTPASRDEDHIRVIADINPQVPNRHTQPEAAGRTLGEMARALKTAGAEILAMPCNTAHAHAEAIRAAGLPFIDMVAETARAAGAAGARRIGVLATPGGEALYAAALAAEGLEMVAPSPADRERFMRVVFGVKAGDLGEGQRAAMREMAEALVAAGAEAVIGGCTEVPLLLAAEAVPVPLIDSAEVLARACVAACR